MNIKQIKGLHGENLAKKFLEAKGYRPEAERFSSRTGEIDLIMWDYDELVFVEVKLRTNDTYSFPEDMVTFSKQNKMLKTALFYLNKKKYDVFFRFDIIALTEKNSQYEIVHFRDIIRKDR